MGTTCPIRNTSPFLGLHARAREAPHQSTDEGRSAPVHECKKLHGQVKRYKTQDKYNIRTNIATTRPNRPIRWKLFSPRLSVCFSLTHVLLHNISNCNSEFVLLWAQNMFNRFWMPWVSTFRMCWNFRRPKCIGVIIQIFSPWLTFCFLPDSYFASHIL